MATVSLSLCRLQKLACLGVTQTPITSTGMGEMASVFDGNAAQVVLRECAERMGEMEEKDLQMHALTTEGFEMD